jgi:hypothetical protein
MNTSTARIGDRLTRDGRTYQVTRITPAGAHGTRVSDGPTVHATIVDPETDAPRVGGFTVDIWTGSMSYPAAAYELVNGASS